MSTTGISKFEKKMTQYTFNMGTLKLEKGVIIKANLVRFTLYKHI